MTTFHFGETLHRDTLIGRTYKLEHENFFCFYHNVRRLEYQSVTRVPVCLGFQHHFLPKCGRQDQMSLSPAIPSDALHGGKIPVLRKGSPLIMLMREQGWAKICHDLFF